MTPREMDAEVARVILGKVPCDKWERRNFGSGGGPVIMLTAGSCEHERGKCYSTLDNGPVLGLRPYYSAPTWETTGEILEAMQRDRYYIETRNDGEIPGERYAYTNFTGPSGATTEVDGFGPEAVIRAACAARGITVDQLTA